MAIDTEAKRRSAINQRYCRKVLPVADNDMTVEDRAHVLWIYRGLDFLGGLASAAGDGLAWLIRRRNRVKRR